MIQWTTEEFKPGRLELGYLVSYKVPQRTLGNSKSPDLVIPRYFARSRKGLGLKTLEVGYDINASLKKT